MPAAPAVAAGVACPGAAAPGTVSPPDEARRLGLLLAELEIERCTLWWGGDWRLEAGGPADGPITCRRERDEPDWEPSDSSCRGTTGRDVRSAADRPM